MGTRNYPGGEDNYWRTCHWCFHSKSRYGYTWVWQDGKAFCCSQCRYDYQVEQKERLQNWYLVHFCTRGCREKWEIKQKQQQVPTQYCSNCHLHFPKSMDSWITTRLGHFCSHSCLNDNERKTRELEFDKNKPVFNAQNQRWLTNLGANDPHLYTTFKDCVIGRPEPTPFYTVAELERMGLVGVWERPKNVIKEIPVVDTNEMKFVTNACGSKADPLRLVVGRSKATEYHTVEELEGMGMFGVYQRPELVILIF